MRTIQLDTTQITNKKSLNEALSNLMDYPEWHQENVSEWIDLIAVGQRPEPALERFRKAKQDMFVIEVQQSLDFFERKRRLFKIMMQSINHVNETSIARVGHPVVTLTLR